MTDPLTCLKPVPQRLSYIVRDSSPTRQRHEDDLLVHTAPSSVVGALSSPTGALRYCMDSAPTAEQDFMRTALVSQLIREWLDELEAWDWPAGFSHPDAPLGKLSAHAANPQSHCRAYQGSVSAEDVVRYGDRIDKIYHQMEDLAVEDIKQHVLTSHIMPLSKPSTSISDAGRPSTSLAPLAYNKMDDLTAFVTTIVVQTLPNLARLWYLLRVWTVRLRVLRRVAPLHAIDDAEAGLRLGWAALGQGKATLDMADAPNPPPPPILRRDTFDIMNRVLASKVAEPGRALDSMLDCLESMSDTLPDAWIDRVDELERDYVDWVAVCERMLCENQWATLRRPEPRPTSAQADRDSEAGRPPGFGRVSEKATCRALASPVKLKAQRDGQSDEQSEWATADWATSSPSMLKTSDQSPATRS